MPDFNNPITSNQYAALLASIVENNKSALKFLDGVTPLTNLPTNSKRWNSGSSRFENYNGSSWDALATLFEMKVRNSDQLNGQTESFYRNANNLNAGSLPSARFGDSSHGSRAGGTLHALATTIAHGFMSSSDKSKINGIESGATADQSANEILTLLLTVDGVGTGLDADKLDGEHGSAYRKKIESQLLSTISDAGALAAKNTVANGDIVDGSINRQKIDTITNTYSGTLSEESVYWAPLAGHTFLPMLYADNCSINVEANLSTISADQPRIKVVGGYGGGNYTIKYRYIQP